MAKRCPPGVICIENVTIVFAFIILTGVIVFISLKGQNSSTNERIIIKERPEVVQTDGLFPRPSYSFSNMSNDVLMNPYQAPLRDDRYFPSLGGGSRGIPINIPTQSVEASYRQVGILTRLNGVEMILPLMGRPLFANRDKWNFYTMSDKNNMIKLPVTNKGRSCTNEYGCDNIYNGDTVYVEGYNDAFKATVYDNQVMRYIPFL
jgi:hypothetical protein